MWKEKIQRPSLASGKRLLDAGGCLRLRGTRDEYARRAWSRNWGSVTARQLFRRSGYGARPGSCRRRLGQVKEVDGQ